MTGRAQPLTAVALVITAIALVALPAAAQSSYIGGSYSWSALDSSFSTNNAKGYKLFIGYDYARFFGLEAGYVNFGKFNGGMAGNGVVDLTGKGWDVALTGRVPLGTMLALTARIGYLFWKTDLSSTIAAITGGNDSGRNFFYGFGIRINLVPSLALLAEWERYKVGTGNVDLVNAGLRINF
jgi:OmpA-OmpF porin, OOP family